MICKNKNKSRDEHDRAFVDLGLNGVRGNFRTTKFFGLNR